MFQLNIPPLTPALAVSSLSGLTFKENLVFGVEENKLNVMVRSPTAALTLASPVILQFVLGATIEISGKSAWKSKALLPTFIIKVLSGANEKPSIWAPPILSPIEVSITNLSGVV
jgi:hypothetical protein